MPHLSEALAGTVGIERIGRTRNDSADHSDLEPFVTMLSLA